MRSRYSNYDNVKNDSDGITGAPILPGALKIPKRIGRDSSNSNNNTKNTTNIYNRISLYYSFRLTNRMDIKVRVRFLTKHDEYSVPLTPFSIPSKLGRYGLSEIINHLLDLNTNQPFDFTINGKLIRVSLSKFISLYHISTEDVIAIEYMPAISISDESQTCELPSWIGCFSCTNNNDILDNVIISGCYDGQVRFNDVNNLSIISTVIVHDEPIRDIKTFSIDNNNQYIATASKDMSVKCWLVQKDNTTTDKITTDTKKRRKTKTNDMDIDESKVAYNMTQVGILNGHSNSVESLSYWNAKGILLSGDWNGNVMGWNVGAIESNSTNNNIKKSNNDDTIVDLKPVFTLRAHVQSVSGMYQSDDHLFTSSWDHSLKQWDLEKQDCINTYAGSKVITSLHVGTIDRNLIATSHPDGRVRVWDQRLKSESGTVGSFSSKDGKDWVSQVRWHPSSGNIFASSDYEGTVKVWDLRSSIPLGTSDAHQGKALCIDWIVVDDVIKVVSGGSDCIIRSTAIGSF